MLVLVLEKNNKYNNKSGIKNIKNVSLNTNIHVCTEDCLKSLFNIIIFNKLKNNNFKEYIIEEYVNLPKPINYIFIVKIHTYRLNVLQSLKNIRIYINIYSKYSYLSINLLNINNIMIKNYTTNNNNFRNISNTWENYENFKSAQIRKVKNTVRLLLIKYIYIKYCDLSNLNLKNLLNSELKITKYNLISYIENSNCIGNFDIKKIIYITSKNNIKSYLNFKSWNNTEILTIILFLKNVENFYNNKYFINDKDTIMVEKNYNLFKKYYKTILIDLTKQLLEQNLNIVTFKMYVLRLQLLKLKIYLIKIFYNKQKLLVSNDIKKVNFLYLTTKEITNTLFKVNVKKTQYKNFTDKKLTYIKKFKLIEDSSIINNFKTKTYTLILIKNFNNNDVRRLYKLYTKKTKAKLRCFCKLSNNLVLIQKDIFNKKGRSAIYKGFKDIKQTLSKHTYTHYKKTFIVIIKILLLIPLINTEICIIQPNLKYFIKIINFFLLKPKVMKKSHMYNTGMEYYLTIKYYLYFLNILKMVSYKYIYNFSIIFSLKVFNTGKVKKIINTTKLHIYINFAPQDKLKKIYIYNKKLNKTNTKGIVKLKIKHNCLKTSRFVFFKKNMIKKLKIHKLLSWIYMYTFDNNTLLAKFIKTYYSKFYKNYLLIWNFHTQCYKIHPLSNINNQSNEKTTYLIHEITYNYNNLYNYNKLNINNIILISNNIEFKSYHKYYLSLIQQDMYSIHVLLY